MKLKKIGKLVTLMSMIMGLSLVAAQTSFAEGIVTDKDTIENRGPGNLDVPMEKSPTKTNDAKKAGEKEAEKKADPKAPAKAEAPAKTPAK